MATDYVDAGQAVDNSSLSGIVGSAPPVTDGLTYERILNARSEPQNWLTYYGAYDGQRYSPLDQINKETIKQLTPAWVFQCGSVGLHSGKSTYSFEASPLVVDGVMYVSGWDGWVWALDARTGNILWQYRTASAFDVSLCCHRVDPVRASSAQTQPSQPDTYMMPSTTSGEASNEYVDLPECRPTEPHWKTHAGVSRLTVSLLIWSSGL